ncbi:MAG: hypothetical protein AABY22_16065 [Nanoarchaeota archaeon]
MNKYKQLVAELQRLKRDFDIIEHKNRKLKKENNLLLSQIRIYKIKEKRSRRPTD